MGLSSYILRVKYNVVYANLCRIARLSAVTMILPAVVAVLFGEFFQALIFLIIGSLGFAVGLTGRAAGGSDMSGKEALVVVALSYLAYGAMGAFAFLPQTTYLNGFFETISGITTTGLTVLRPESLPRSLVFFRSFSQWLGGAGIIVLSLLILRGPSRNAFKLYTTEFGEEKLMGNVRATAKLVMVVYSILTAAGFLVYLAVGFGPFAAVIHILATVSTGGFSASSESIGHFGGIAQHLAVTVFMLLGAVGFPAFYLLRRRGVKAFFGDLQLRYLAVLVLLSWVAMWGAWGWSADKALPGFFTSVTSASTTGFTTVAESTWPVSVVLISIVLMLIGGSSGSTAGGIKIYRLIVTLQTIRWYVLRALLPSESKIAVKVHGRAVNDDMIKQTFSICGLYLMLAAASALCFVMYGGYPVIRSVIESVSAIGTVGQSSSDTSHSMPAFLKIDHLVDRWLGRLEILPVLVTFYPKIWFSRRSQ
ncbi:MAG: TrkH family potassium uptake protein [bacterium]